MKEPIAITKVVKSITVKALIAIALCICFVSYPQLRVSSARLTATRAIAGVKSESQFRSEGSRYDGAIRAISSITTMNAGFGAGSELKLIRVGFDLEKQPGTTRDNEIVSFQDPVTLVIGSILLAIFVATVLYAIALPIALTIVDLFVIEEPDEFARCQQEADDVYKTCISEAEALPFPLNLAAMAVCGAAWLRDQATCALAT
jgi:hypothetical protein